MRGAGGTAGLSREEGAKEQEVGKNKVGEVEEEGEERETGESGRLRETGEPGTQVRKMGEVNESGWGEGVRNR